MTGHFEKGAWIEDKILDPDCYDDKHIDMFLSSINEIQGDYYCEVGARPDLLIFHPHDCGLLGAVERYLWSAHRYSPHIGSGVRSLLGMKIQISETITREGFILVTGKEMIRYTIGKFVGERGHVPLILIHGIALEFDIRCYRAT